MRTRYSNHGNEQCPQQGGRIRNANTAFEAYRIVSVNFATISATQLTLLDWLDRISESAVIDADSPLDGSFIRCTGNGPLLNISSIYLDTWVSQCLVLSKLELWSFLDPYLIKVAYNRDDLVSGGNHGGYDKQSHCCL